MQFPLHLTDVSDGNTVGPLIDVAFPPIQESMLDLEIPIQDQYR